MKSIHQSMLLLSTLLIATNTYAACERSSKTVFSCTTTNNKQIEVCDAGKTISYAFGKKGRKPELTLSVPRDEATTFQWLGIGRYTNYSVTIPNGKYRYNVYSSHDKSEENEAKAFEAGVAVEEGDKLLAKIICRDETVINHIDGINLRTADD